MSLLFSRKRNTLKEISAVETPEPTDSHTPVPHILLIDLAKKAMKAAGLTIMEQEHALARGGQRYFGGFAVEGEDLKSDDRQLVIGLRNAHDKSCAAGICVGNRMMVCDNMCFSSDETFGRRHTKNIFRDIKRVLAGCIARVKSHWLTMEERIALYRAVELSREMAANLLIDLVDAKAFTARDIYPTIKEFESPGWNVFTSDQYAKLTNDAKTAQVAALDASHGGHTLWTLYNAVTENLKGGNLSLLPARTMAMQTAFDKMCDFSPVIEADVIDDEGEGEVQEIEGSQV